MFIDQSSANSSNGTEKKCYDIRLLKKIKDDPLSKGKPDIPLLEELNVLRSTPIQDHAAVFETMIRPHNDTLLPSFAKSPGMGSKSLHDNRKDGRNMGSSSGRGSMKMSGSSRTPNKPVVHLSLLSSENVKLNETENAWRPSRLKKDNLTEEEETQELYKKFRGILNKLTPQKFKTLLEKVKTLEINNQKRLEGVIDLVFEKAIEEPNFSEAYALMCAELSTLKVPADKTNAASDGFVNFRVLIITKCQNQFVTKKSDEQILKLEKECNDCTDPAKKKELQLQLDEENRKVRMRSVGNVRFIGELYKLKMLTAKIMVFCMNYLIEKLEEENLECLCKLLTTIGQQIESEAKGQLDSVFKKMHDIVSKKSDKISSRVRFMLQDVIELRAKNWQGKNVIDSKPKLMGQIQKEAEQRQRDIELMNANPGGGYRRDDGGRGNRERLDGRRSQNTFADNNAWKTRTSYKVDPSKLKAFAAQNTKNFSNIKLAPQNRGWNHGSGTRNTQPGSLVNLTTNNVFSVLENVQADPISITGNKEELSYQPKGASIEGSSLKSRNDITSGNGGGRSRSMVVPPTAEKPTPEPSQPLETVEDPTCQPTSQEPLPESKKKSVKSMIDLCLINPDDSELVGEVKHLFPPQYHAGLVSEILNIALEKSSNDLDMIAKSLLHLVATNTISPDNLLEGLNEILEFAPDLYIDVPMLYDHLGRFIAPQIERKHITLAQLLTPNATVISSNQGHLFLKAIIKELKNSMGPSFVKTKWQESGLELNQWMEEDQVPKWLEENQFQFLLGNSASEETKEESTPAASEETKKELTPAEIHSKLVLLMKSDESIETIKGWIQDNVGSARGEEWFLRALSQAACAQALAGTDAPLLSPERLCKYSELLLFGERPQSAKEATCLFAIQHLIHRLEHPQGLTVELFQYLHENYIISVEGFVAWEQCDKEPEGKAVMLKALTSFFTNIKEADNEESGSDE